MSEDNATQLSAIDARILASLFEKEATTPDAYPLTLNAIVLACNQKTAREPVMELEQGEVANALRRLETRGFVKSQHTARAERYSHRLEAVLSLTKPQTAHELLARSDRLARFEGIEDVQHALERLSRRAPALVVALPRQAGQRGERFAHLLCGEPDVSAVEASSTGAGAQSPMSERVAELEQRVAQLEARLSALESGRGAG